MPSDTEKTSAKAGLVRALGPAHAASIVIGIVIGSGIFLVPAEMMQAAGSAKLVYLAWIVGGIFSFFGAATYAELGAMKPQAGGEYVYIRDAYGPLAGFLCGWTWTIVVKPSSLAAISTGIVRILGSISAFSFLMLPGGHLTAAGKLVAIAFVAFVSLINYVGVRRAGNFQLVFTILKIVLILGIAALAFTSHGTWSHFGETFSGAKCGIRCRRGGGALGLRRVERSQHGGGRGALAGAEHPAGDGRGICSNRRAIHAGKRRGAVCASRGRRSRFRVAYVGCSAEFSVGGSCGDSGRGRHGGFSHHLFKWSGDERVAHGVCTLA
jgi:amino acid transporter